MRQDLLWKAEARPCATAMLTNMQNNATGSGMGSAGLVGQLTTYETMIAYDPAGIVLAKIILLHFILPAVLSLIFSELMRKKG